MTMSQAEVDGFLSPLIDRLAREHSLHKDSPDFWALRAAQEFPLPHGHKDRGIFSIYLLNLVRLHPGEATYQSAGTLHAYLEGVNVRVDGEFRQCSAWGIYFEKCGCSRVDACPSF
jgi:mannose-6-phosphate isomerase class I